VSPFVTVFYCPAPAGLPARRLTHDDIDRSTSYSLAMADLRHCRSRVCVRHL
jgi:hypothetical protein